MDNTKKIVELHDTLSKMRKEIFEVKYDMKFSICDSLKQEYRIKFVDLLSEKRKVQQQLDYLLATYNNLKESN